MINTNITQILLTYSRKGLGLIVSGRAFEFNEDFLKDIVFYSYKIKNDGTKPLNKLGLSIYWWLILLVVKVRTI